MGIYKNILVAFDGAKSSENALKQMLKVAKREDSVVTAVTVLRKIDCEPVRSNGTDDDPVALACTMLGNSVKVVLEEDGSEVYAILEEGVIHETIIDVAKSRDCDLIIMGRRCLTGIERAFAGSFTARVIRHSPIDVLVVPKDATLGWKNILLATDGSDCSETAAAQALEIAKTHGRELKVAFVVDTMGDIFVDAPGMADNMMDKAKDAFNSIEGKAKIIDVNVETFMVEGEPHKEIVNLANHLKSDVICMGSHGRTGLSRWIMGSVTEKVLESAKCSVLVVKPKNGFNHQ